MTKSHDKIGHLSGYIQNFEDINEKELHLFEHLNLAEIVREHNSPYFDFYEMVREMVKFSYDAATGKITGGKAFFE